MQSNATPFKRRLFTIAMGAALAATSGVALAQAKAAAKPLAGQTVKLMWIDPLTGLMGPVGTNQLKSQQFITAEGERDVDVFAIVGETGEFAVSVMLVRGGRNLGTTSYFPRGPGR